MFSAILRNSKRIYLSKNQLYSSMSISLSKLICIDIATMNKNNTKQLVMFYSKHNNNNNDRFNNYITMKIIGLLTTSILYYQQDTYNNVQCDNKNYQSSSNNHISNSLLSRNFVVDAIDLVAPSVVNIMCSVDGIFMHGVSSGSGFIITEDGYIVTNAHVIAASNNGKVLVTTMNGKKRIGKIHSKDAISDIALIKIESDYDGEKFPMVPLGTSSTVKSGEFVIALGSPLQLQNSASFGIISATARHASELGLANNRAEYIQTDAAINLGNSGGPLINLDGEVIGISTMKVKDTDGISFAIPVDTATQVIKQLMLYHRVVRPYVGLKLANFIPNTSSTNGYRSKSNKNKKLDLFETQETQVIVVKVEHDSPAELAGFISGDIISEVDGKPVLAVRDILDVIGLHVEKEILFKIIRGNNEQLLRLITKPERTK